MKTIVLASGNRGKLAELQAALAPLDWDLRPLSDYCNESPEETGSTFEDNALIKARHAARISGLPALADDSGLSVRALGGAPGVYSARYAGSDATDTLNNEKLLRELASVPDAERDAKFICVIALVENADDPNPMIARGEWNGRILQAPRGEAGFGYDPLFLDEESGLSSAELTRDKKLAKSHRGKAIRDLMIQLHGRP